MMFELRDMTTAPPIGMSESEKREDIRLELNRRFAGVDLTADTKAEIERIAKGFVLHHFPHVEPEVWISEVMGALHVSVRDGRDRWTMEVNLEEVDSEPYFTLQDGVLRRAGDEDSQTDF